MKTLKIYNTLIARLECSTAATALTESADKYADALLELIAGIMTLTLRNMQTATTAAATTRRFTRSEFRQSGTTGTFTESQSAKSMTTGQTPTRTS